MQNDTATIWDAQSSWLFLSVWALLISLAILSARRSKKHVRSCHIEHLISSTQNQFLSKYLAFWVQLILYIQKRQLSGDHPPPTQPRLGSPNRWSQLLPPPQLQSAPLRWWPFFGGSDKTTEDTTILVHTPAYPTHGSLTTKLFIQYYTPECWDKTPAWYSFCPTIVSPKDFRVYTTSDGHWPQAAQLVALFVNCPALLCRQLRRCFSRSPKGSRQDQHCLSVQRNQTPNLRGTGNFVASCKRKLTSFPNHPPCVQRPTQYLILFCDCEFAIRLSSVEKMEPQFEEEIHSTGTIIIMHL